MTTATIHWDITLTAVSSIAHAGETRGTLTLLRRERAIQDDGRSIHVPVVSGNALRGHLRRAGEEMLRDTLDYDGRLELPAAHALRGGGSLAKTAREPISGARLARLRHLVPHLSVFGAAVGARTIHGAINVGKVVPHFTEARSMLPHLTGEHLLGAFTTTQIETYTRHDDADQHDFPAVHVPVDHDGYPRLDGDEAAGHSQLMLYRIETLPAGMRLSTWLRLHRGTPLEVAVVDELLHHYAQFGRLGGRAGRGHGHVEIALSRQVITGLDKPEDWRSHVQQHRDEAIDALHELS